MARLRVLQIDLWEGPGHAYYAGSLAAAAARRDDLEVAILHNRAQDLALYGGPFRSIPVRAPTGASLAQWDRLVLQPVEFARALLAVERFRPDVVHFVFTYPWFTVAMPLLARRWRVASTWHDITPHHGEETLRNRLGNAALIRHSRAIFVHGAQALAEARDLHPEAVPRLHSIPFGHSDFLNAGVDLARPAEPGTFLFFGRMLPYKGLAVALEAMERLALTHPQARLIVAGAGSIERERPALERLGDRVEIVNRGVSDAELADLTLRSVAVLAPYTHASGSGVAAAAAAFERPLVASRLGGLIDMVEHGRTGLLFNPGDAADLAATMARALDQPAETAEMGRQARRRMLEVGDWDAIMETTARVYREIAG